MRSFHVALHALPAAATHAPLYQVELNGQPFEALALESSHLAAAPMEHSFEQATERLGELDGLFIEPDGSFVWTGSLADGQRWQLEGNLYDRNGRLLQVDLKGTCSAETLNRLLNSLAGEQRSVVFQMLQEGIFLGEPEFIRYATRHDQLP